MPSHQKSSADVTAIGIDIGKNTFHLIGQDRRGKVVMRARVSRAQLIERLVNVPRCLIGMEAGAGAHHIARQLIEIGHEVRLIPAQYVKPFLKSHKNDYRDAEAIIEAVQRPTMSFVAVKTAEQCDLQAIHRVRSRLVRLRTGAINQIRGLLLERGVVIGQRTAPLRKALPVILADPPKHLSPRVLRLIMALIDELNMLEVRIVALTEEIEALAAEDDACQRLMSVPGIGVIISSAVVSAIGTGETFKQGRDFAAWLGLVPRQVSTGGRTKLAGLSKRGNCYLRHLFVQAAHVILVKKPAGAQAALWPWIERAAKRMAHRNLLATALANKLARIAWAVLARGHSYRPIANPAQP